MDIVIKNSDEWRGYLSEGRDNSVKALLDFGKRVQEYKQSCKVKQGGTEFASNMKEWLGMSKQVSMEWARIGEEGSLRMFGDHMDSIPASKGALYRIATLNEDDFEDGIAEGAINSEATAADIMAFKLRLDMSDEAKTRMVLRLWAETINTHYRTMLKENMSHEEAVSLLSKDELFGTGITDHIILWLDYHRDSSKFVIVRYDKVAEFYSWAMRKLPEYAKSYKSLTHR